MTIPLAVPYLRGGQCNRAKDQPERLPIVLAVPYLMGRPVQLVPPLQRASEQALAVPYRRVSLQRCWSIFEPLANRLRHVCYAHLLTLNS